ncbi:uncharacterized protein LOC122510030 [Leptopilina heterotoma]|uniref:uncharacterized protein LOC122510030 n=1 Tax=Leptopilina heterotoma TaxID=63436 RepID=UPI001CA7DF10|nr:uncharacterized protein LOC122510030 [Leptopilina heterotoma]
MATASQNLEVEVIMKGRVRYLHVNGFLYTKHSSGVEGKIYWRCRSKGQCGARATTITTGHTLNLVSGGEMLQEMYNNPNDDSIREASRSMCALAFVRPEDVPAVFDLFLDQVPEDFVPIAEYFEVWYIRGKPARGRRKAVSVRYAPILWNHYQAVNQRISRTNNASEGWHNRFQVVLGRYHPSLYAFLNELQQEQGDTECMINQLNLGQKIRTLPTTHFQKMEEKVISIVSQYQNYVDENREIDYIKALGHHLHF